jgi:hypothetical protein
MDMKDWVLKLNQWGFKDALQHPKTTVAFYVTFTVLRWIAIALAIAVAAIAWMMISIVANAMKSR